jgi:hypothetical protein
MWQRVTLVRTDVSEERIASIIRLTRISESVWPAVSSLVVGFIFGERIPNVISDEFAVLRWLMT